MLNIIYGNYTKKIEAHNYYIDKQEKINKQGLLEDYIYYIRAEHETVFQGTFGECKETFKKMILSEKTTGWVIL